MNDTHELISVVPQALFVDADANVSLEMLNERLHRDGLCLPFVPLQRGLTLRQLVQRNEGGRRLLRYGTITRALRGMRVQSPTAPACVLGGTTMKRATGYRLPYRFVGQHKNNDDMKNTTIARVTLSVRPLPAARCALLVALPTYAAAFVLAEQCIQRGVALSAMAFISLSHPDAAVGDVIHAMGWHIHPTAHVLMLIELEESPAVLQRHLYDVTTLLNAMAIQLLDATTIDHAPSCYSTSATSHWRVWEEYARHVALTMTPMPYATLDVTLPRSAMVRYLDDATHVASRYRVSFAGWGDAGAGTFHAQLIALPTTQMPTLPTEIAQAQAIMVSMARQLGGSISTATQVIVAHGADNTDNSDMSATQNTFFSTLSPTRPIGDTLRIAPIAQNVSDGRQLLLAQVRAIVGNEHVLVRADELDCYMTDASIALPNGMPLAVVLPACTDEVARVMQCAAAARVPVVARGAGTGLAGGATACAGSLVMPLTRMQRIRIDADQRVAHVDAGVLTADLQRAAEAHGLFYPPDPSSQAASTIGGNIACNAGGPRCLKYGVTSDYVVQLTVVLAHGQMRVVGDGLHAQTNDANLLHLLIGSEGTLAIITEATVRLIQQPVTRRTVFTTFATLHDACTTVEHIMAAGIVPAALELMDATTIAVVEAYVQAGLPCDAAAVLLMQADGEPETVADEVAQLVDYARRGGATRVQVAHAADDEAVLWKARRSISPALARIRPNKLGEDISVPVMHVAHTVQQIQAIAEQYCLPIPVFGHAGDGNLHPNILFDARNRDEVARVWQAAADIFAVALACGGTLSGEHGIGVLKRHFMETALGTYNMQHYHTIKQAYDPHGLLNPGKVLPTCESASCAA